MAVSETPGTRTTTTPVVVVRRVRDVVPGLLAALAVAGVATAAGAEVPVVGGPVLGIVIGLLLATVLAPGPRWRPGFAVAARPVLQASIVVLGATLSLTQVAAVGLSSLPVMLGTLVVALGGAWLLGRLLGIERDTTLLVGVGTAICGASAIAATQSVLRARESTVAYAIGTIFVFNIAAVLAFPPIGHLLGLDPHAFGLWAGTAINDTSSVVAAGYAYGGDAGPYSVVVKLTRSLMIIPVVMAVAFLVARRGGAAPAPGRRPLPWTRLVPLFLVGFVVASALTTVGVVPTSWHPAVTAVGTFLITTALAGIGLSMRLADLRRAGVRPLLLGGCLWVLVAASSLGIQAIAVS
ncbi:YeiH family protein [Actinomycetospora soli]|uniref:YeiH family protein n=1 Tax=Actinomycetospora soli TaxID=2893887 RepID=UPI001E45C261|nr:putative sulfate exporter family transporter [Actinomycetospora soli]MCD2189045.1 putative sulfate exporter family transporter [Actinomycetospora soli]